MKQLRVPEWVKNLLLVLLSLSAVFLFTLSPLYLNSPLRGWTGRIFPGKEGASSAPVALTAAARPARIAVTNAAGRYGVQYDTGASDALFDQTGVLLGEALGSAGAAVPLTEDQWRSALGAEGIYFDFTGSIPFSALAGWLQGEENSGVLTGDVRRLLLAPGEDGKVWLYYQDAWEPERFFACPTALNAEAHLTPVASAFAPNGARFAFEEASLEHCYPYTLITDNLSEAAVYSAASPATALGGAGLDAALSGLSFSGALVTSYTVDGATVYRTGEDTLLVSREGSLTYHGVDGSLYPVASAGEVPTLAEMIETTRQLLAAAVEPLCGDARLYLISARQEGESTLITYGYSLGGALVWTGNDGWAAEFRLTGALLTGFTLNLRSYTAQEGSTPLLPAHLAAAAMTALDARGSELLLVYRDGGGDTVCAAWVAV